MKYFNYLVVVALVFSVISFGLSIRREVKLGTVYTTDASDTLETFRTNVNASLSSLQTLTASSTGFSSSYLDVGATATTSLRSNGTVGIGSSTPLGKLGIGTTGATSTISGGYFCMYFKDEANRGMWIKLATSGSSVFSTSTTACN